MPPSLNIAPVNRNDTMIRHNHLGLLANESGIVRQRPANHDFFLWFLSCTVSLKF